VSRDKKVCRYKVIIGIDIETAATEGKIKPVACLAVSIPGDDPIIFDHHASKGVIKDLLASEYTLAGHNVAFDLACLAYQDQEIFPQVFGAYETGRIYDTMISAQLADIAEGSFQGSRKGLYALDDCTLRYLGKRKADDAWRLRYGELLDVPIQDWPEDAVYYAKQDAVLTRELAESMPYYPDLERQCAYAFWLYLTSARGMATDKDRVTNLLNSAADRGGILAQDLLKKGILSWDNGKIVRKQAPMKALLENILGDEVLRTDKGGVSTGAEACEKAEKVCDLRGISDPTFAAYAEFSKISDLLSKDAEYLTRGIVQPSFGLAETGRSTCFAPNLQNIKKSSGVRECFVPREGYLFAIADYDGLEMSTMAQVCYSLLGYSKLRDVINNGEDAHAHIAKELLGCDYATAKRRRKDPEDHDGYSAGQTAKVVNFGFPGGLGYKAFIDFAWSGYRVKVTIQDAKRLKAIWYDIFPEFREYFQLIERLPDPIEHLFSGRLRGKASFPARANTLFQGLGSEVAKSAGFAVSKACYSEPSSPLYGSHIVNFEHDALILEVPEKTAHEAAEEMARLMVAAPKNFMPDVKLMTEPALARRWSKKVKTIRDENGKLLPWDDAKGNDHA
jgi:hypothetical protein